MTDREFAAILIGGLIGVTILAACVAWFVYEIRHAPLIEAETRAADPDPFDYGPVDVDRIDEYVVLWAAQQRKEGR